MNDLLPEITALWTFLQNPYFKCWNGVSKQNIKKSQEENAGTEVALQVRGFCAVRGRMTLGKQVCSKFHSVHCKGSSENQLIYKDTGKRPCPLVEGTEHMESTE